MTNDGKSLLEGAYALDTPQDNKKYYESFASTYDRAFVSQLGYTYPAKVAEIFANLNLPSNIKIADIGCGTGSLAEALGPCDIDGFDISPQMLEVAKSKGLYHDTFEIDLTQLIPLHFRKYDAILSSGTFTHGHLGPDALEKLLRLAQPNATLCIGINNAHYDSHGFSERLKVLQNSGAIGAVHTTEVPIYEGKTHEHAKDTALVVTFRTR